MNKDNLKILSDWLEDNMDRIKSGNAFDMSEYECGTCHCAAGWATHIPEFKLLFKSAPLFAWNYTAFVEQIFEIDPYMDQFDFLFNAKWTRFDNTIEGAIARIRYLVDGNELPDAKNFYNPEIYKAYLPK